MLQDAGMQPNNVLDFIRHRDVDDELPPYWTHNHIETPEGFSVTSVAEQLRGVISVCVQMNSVVLVMGRPGLGKTIAARWIASSDPYHAIYMMVSKTQGTLSGYMKLLADSAGWYTDRESSSGLWCIAKNRLPEEAGRGRYLIVDDAQNLEPDAMIELVGFRERANIPIILIGNLDTLSRKKAGLEYDRLSDRIWTNNLKSPDNRDFDLLGSHYNLDGKETYSLLARYGHRTSMRQADRLLQIAKTLAASRGRIGKETLEEAISYLHSASSNKFFKA